MRPIEIWVEFASTYSYLTVARAEGVLAKAGVGFVWRPFLLGPIFRSKGMATSPFLLDPVKGAYMWRDMERRAAKLGLPFQRPDVFPQNSLTAARVMTAALDQPWCGGFARAVYAAQFGDGADIGDERVIAAALERAGVDPAPWLAAARQEPAKSALRATTDAAMDHGVFGAPSFRVGEELFWGDDRLEDAVSFAHAIGDHGGDGFRA